MIYGNNPHIKQEEAVLNAWKNGTVVPAFNVFYLPAIEPLVRAIRDTRIYGLIEVARLEWTKFHVKGLCEVYKEFISVAAGERCVGLHLDHVPVIDEDGEDVDFIRVISDAVQIGYGSIMVDGSRLPFKGNVSATKKAVEIAHAAGIPAEAELGAVMGHEAGPMSCYEEIFSSGRGFTDPVEAGLFVKETCTDWLSIAAGNIHGAVSGSLKNRKKRQARLNIGHIEKIRSAAGVPLVLHGGTGIERDFIREGIKAGIAKINIGTAVRKAFEKGIKISLNRAREGVYETAVYIIEQELDITNSIDKIAGNSN